ncbi:RICIN domain-containing protein [Planctellipticum variicoloris]|uniref:RICIN domain-containing protein n=1 Tax=Planctellipticum variicoloris TaxID=3064265 RepID=UPI003013BDB8|nr:RICIN domain-containing protein [Planctomycetaceae bacterium SH412]
MKSLRYLPILTACLLLAGVDDNRCPADDASEAAHQEAIARFEESDAALVESMLEALAKAEQIARRSGNAALVSRLSSEREQFKQQRVVPASVDAGSRSSYLARLDRQCTQLLLPCQKQITVLSKGGDFERAEQEELKLGQRLIGVRGYGIAIPPPNKLGNLQFLLRNRQTGGVLDVTDAGDVVVAPEVRGRRPQLWRLLIVDDHAAIANLDRKKVLNIPTSSWNPGLPLIVYSEDGNGANERWLISEEGKSVVITSRLNKLVLDVDTDSGRLIQNTPDERKSQRWMIEARR